MSELALYIKAVEKNVVSAQLPLSRHGSINRIELAADAGCDSSVILLLAHPSQLPPPDVLVSSAMVFFTCPLSALDTEALPRCNWAVVSLSLQELYTRLNAVAQRCRCIERIEDVLRLAKASNYSVEKLIRALSELLNVGIFILNSDHQMVTGSFSGTFNDRYAEELASSGALSSASMQSLKSGLSDAGAIRNHIHMEEFGQWKGFQVLLIYQAAAFSAPDILCERISEYVEEAGALANAGAIPFLLTNDTLNRILLGKLTDPHAIHSFFSDTGDMGYRRVMVLHFDGQAQLVKRQEAGVRLLRRVFSEVVTTFLDGTVVAVMRANMSPQSRLSKTRSDWTGRSYAAGWDDRRFLEELRAINAYACMCPPFLSTYNFPVLYTVMRKVLKIALLVEGAGLDRLIDHEKYNPYIITQMCVDNFLQTYTPSQIKMLMYPDTVTLLRYDLVNDTNLSMILYTYLNCGDVGKTAQKLYMHRNTVYNKIKQIEKILDLQLDDMNPRDCYMTALRIYFYCEKCLGLDMRSILLHK